MLTGKLRLVAAIGLLLLAGLLTVPAENAISRQMKADGLVAPPLNTTLSERVGQRSFVVSLGGLRTLLADMESYRAWSEFERANWRGVEERFETVTALQPRSFYYWDTASWHLAYNASAYYQRDYDAPAAVREVERQRYIARGRAFLEEGIRMNPDNTALKLSLVRLLTDPYKPKDYPAAEKIMREIVDSEDGNRLRERQLLYILVRDKANYREVYERATRMIDEDPVNRVPSMMAIVFALQNALQIPASEAMSLKELFGSEREALRVLSVYWQNHRRTGQPVNGVERTLRALELQLGVPASESVF